jgi:hypothetical protein
MKEYMATRHEGGKIKTFDSHKAACRWVASGISYKARANGHDSCDIFPEESEENNNSLGRVDTLALEA